MNTAATIQENAEDIYAEAQQMNEEREAEEAEEVVSVLPMKRTAGRRIKSRRTARRKVRKNS